MYSKSNIHIIFSDTKAEAEQFKWTKDFDARKKSPGQNRAPKFTLEQLQEELIVKKEKIEKLSAVLNMLDEYTVDLVVEENDMEEFEELLSDTDDEGAAEVNVRIIL